MSQFLVSVGRLGRGYISPVRKIMNGATEKWEKMPTTSECVCCHEIPEVKIFHLKVKTRLFWDISVLDVLPNLCKITVKEMIS